MSGKDSGRVYHYGDSQYKLLVDECVAGLGSSIAADHSAYIYSTCMCTSSGAVLTPPSKHSSSAYVVR